MKRLSKTLLAKTLLSAAFITVSALSLAEEPAQNNTAEMRKQYDFLIGNWDCTFVQFADGKEAAQYPCTWQGKYTFDGLMVQDDFRMYHQEQMVFSGTTLRTFVEQKQRWDLAFLGSGAGHWPNFHGQWKDNQMQITQKGKDQKGEFDAKIHFKNIEQNSFLWTMEKSYDGGKTWSHDMEIRSTRAKS